MDTAHKMFLLAVEEMNFTRAAQRAFVTQQCLSINIKRLESQYGSALFDRSPKLTLTPSGAALYETLRQMRLIEDGLEKQMHEIREGSCGEIVLGMHPSRARIMLPGLLEEYSRKFPKVRVTAVLDDTKNLADKLLHGQLDLFLGIDCAANEHFDVIPVSHDTLYLIATEAFLQRWHAGEDPLILTGEQALNLHQFPDMPFAGNASVSTTNQLIRRYLDSQNLCPNQIFSISDYEAQISLCARNLVAAFCPRLILEHVIDYNAAHPDAEPIQIFRLKDMEEKTRIEIIRPHQSYTPQYLHHFIEVLRRRILAYSEKIEFYLAPHL